MTRQLTEAQRIINYICILSPYVPMYVRLRVCVCVCYILSTLVRLRVLYMYHRVEHYLHVDILSPFVEQYLTLCRVEPNSRILSFKLFHY